MPAASVLLATVVAIAAPAPHIAAPGTVTMTDGKLSATFNITAGADFGLLTSLSRMPAAASVLNVAQTGSSSVWAASFVGGGTGVVGITSRAAACDSTVSTQLGANKLQLKWAGCKVPVTVAPPQPPPSPSPPPPPSPVQWTMHNNSLCSGKCLAKDSHGPKGGHCDRLPGCGHDAGLPFCDAEAMKAWCLDAAGCQCFNTNGYLYTDTGVAPFGEYPLQSYTYGPPPAPPAPPALVNVTVEVTLVDGLLEYTLWFDGDGRCSLWDYTMSVSNIKTAPGLTPFTSTAARQMVGLYSTTGPADAVYYSAHDPDHVVKTCGHSADSDSSQLSCTVLALNATLPLHSYRAGFPMVVTVVAGGDWWDLSQVYRTWVLPNARWTKFGPLETRTDLPPWLENITLWMNNNWGGDPLGPYYGGDPEHVKLEMLKVNSLLNLPSHGGALALHWYEWDTLGYVLGSNHTKCDRTGAPCGFDTHYPDYFPARVGCSDAIKAMQDGGMRVIPYINGQLYDTLIPRYAADNAIVAVQKFTEQTMHTATHTPALTPHLEHFDGITSAVMCPATDYWHGVMRDTIIKCVDEVGFDGVYVDQVGNGETRNCADPNHNHTINGGAFWAEAFDSIMAEVRSTIKTPSMFMTEGTVEEVSGTGFDILLGLDEGNKLPEWHAIYGGYGYATGPAGSINAALDNGLCSKLTYQFMVGGTMGWLTYQNYKDTFFDPANAAYVSYIVKLSQARIAGKQWMVHGRATRTITLTADPDLSYGCFLYEAPAGVAAEAPSVVCAFAVAVTVAKKQAYTLAMDPARYGLVVPPQSQVAVTDLMTNGILGKYSGTIDYAGAVDGLDVQLLKLTVVQ